MSKFTNRGLALAIAAALVLPATAIAATAGYPASTKTTFASNIFGDAAATIVNPAAYSITTAATDNIIGRTTGFGIRLTLGNGVEFATGTAAPAAGTALTDYNAPAVGAMTANVLVISVTPDTTLSPNIGTGTLVEWAAGDLVLTELGALATSGGNVPVTIELFDSNTAQVFQTITGAVLANSLEGTTVVFNPQAGDVNKRIDVATCGTVAAKRRFSPTGVIGGSCGAADTDRLQFNAGSVTLGITQAGPGTPSNVLATGFGGVNNVGGLFGYVPADEINWTITGTDLGAFNAATGNDRVFLSFTADCDTAVPGAVGTITANAISFTTNAFSTNGGSAFVCVAAATPFATQIAAQTLRASVGIDFDDVDVIDPADRSGNLLPMAYNGTVLEFQNVNPASNPRAQSFLRFTNNSSAACPVSVTGRDDSGVAGASAVTLTVGAGASVTLNSEDLENGSTKATGAFGDGVGRWYATADAECGNFVGSALNRNLEDGTITNLTPEKR